MKRIQWCLGLALGLWLLWAVTLPVGAQEGCGTCNPAPPCFRFCTGQPGDSGTQPNPTPPPGAPQPPPDTPPDNPGATPPPAGTPAPPAALGPGDGYWSVQCVQVGGEHGGGAGETGCGGTGYAIIWTWVVPNPALGYPATYPARSRCAAAGECTPVTPTPRAVVTPQARTWPCDIVPRFENGVLMQGCDDWPGWDLWAEACIPGAIVRRYPWPRSLVGLPTKLWYGGAPDLEQFSATKAWPCTVDYGARYPDDDLPECPAPVGQTTNGTRVNYQIGVAWRHWNLTRGAIFGFTPEHEVTWAIADREWNGGTAIYHDYNIEHTFQTSSYGLEEFGTRWNPACQDQDCDCDTRVASLDMPAYDVTLTTWWYPEYTFKYDEMVCATRKWSDCFWRESPPTGLSYSNCATPDYYKIEVCTEYKWENKTTGWQKYNLSLLGYQPVIPWFIATQVGADANGNQCTTGSYGPVGVPVIEVQPVGVP